jgi:hypothetical protein
MEEQEEHGDTSVSLESGEENNGGDAMRRNVLLLDQRALLILLPCLFFSCEKSMDKSDEKNQGKKIHRVNR